MHGSFQSVGCKVIGVEPAGAAKPAQVLRPGGRLAAFWHVFQLAGVCGRGQQEPDGRARVLPRLGDVVAAAWQGSRHLAAVVWWWISA